MLPDEFEGGISMLTSLGQEVEFLGPDSSRDSRRFLTDAGLTHHRILQRLTYLSCWHVNQSESAAMWELYAKSSDAVAIRSTMGRLTEAFGDDERLFSLRMVRYLDYDQEAIDDHRIERYASKRRLFTRESELRAIHQLDRPGGYIKLGEMEVYTEPPEDTEVGITLSVDLQKLIHAVFVHPGSEGWFEPLVGDLLKRYGPSLPVHSSRIGESPFV